MVGVVVVAVVGGGRGGGVVVVVGFPLWFLMALAGSCLIRLQHA